LNLCSGVDPSAIDLRLSRFVLAVTGAIFLVVFALLVYSVVKFRKRRNDDGREPPQLYGSNQVELAWTIIPILIVVALFMATPRVIALVQKTSPPGNAIAITAIGHQFWWEYRYPDLGVVTTNELHVPVSDPVHPTPTSSSCYPPIPTTVFGCRG
jgi:cytochrome c oxidase subunit II